MLHRQHRLHACVKSDTPFTTLIVFVDDNRAFSTLDNGKKRTGADILGIEGYKNTTHLAASPFFINRCLSTLFLVMERVVHTHSDKEKKKLLFS